MPGFDGEDHARLQDLLIASDDIGQFVYAQTKTMPQAMDEIIAEASGLDHLSGSAIDLFAGQAGGGRIRGRLCWRRRQPHR